MAREESPPPVMAGTAPIAGIAAATFSSATGTEVFSGLAACGLNSPMPFCFVDLLAIAVDAGLSLPPKRSRPGRSLISLAVCPLLRPVSLTGAPEAEALDAETSETWVSDGRFSGARTSPA